MKKKLLLILLLFSFLFLYACSGTSNQPSSTFSIEFIDVGQGDAALVECDGRYMLIDGGDESAGDTVYSFLEERGIQHLDILVLSHMHADHIGGLPKALTYASKIDLTLSNTSYVNTAIFQKLEHELGINGAKITVPHEGDKYAFGSAEIEIIDAESTQENDSLVILITYGKTKFLFTGDIEDAAQKRITEKFNNKYDKAFKIDLMKIPHHGSSGSSSSTSYSDPMILECFVKTFRPDYAIISVGKGNMYGHPHEETLALLEQVKSRIYRTDMDGTITVRSDGKRLSVETQK